MKQETKDMILMLLVIFMFAIMLGALAGSISLTAENRTMRQKLQDIQYVVRFNPMDGSDWAIANIITDGKGIGR